VAVADVYAALWRHRLFIIGMTVLVGVVAYVLASTQPKIYEATALVRVEQRGVSAADVFGELQVGQRLAQTYAKIVSTETIRDRVATRLRLSSGQIHLSSSPVSDIELLNVTASSRVPAQAALIANTAVAALQSFVAEKGTTSEKVVAIDPARVPSAPSSPRVKLTVAVAVVLGLLFNSALALLLELFADRLPPVEGMEETFGKAVLATVPELTFKQSATRLSVSGSRGPETSPIAAIGRSPGGTRGN
jgi:succinoglycan biosynthesis transport protein ExoP